MGNCGSKMTEERQHPGFSLGQLVPPHPEVHQGTYPHSNVGHIVSGANSNPGSTLDATTADTKTAAPVFGIALGDRPVPANLGQDARQQYAFGDLAVNQYKRFKAETAIEVRRIKAAAKAWQKSRPTIRLDFEREVGALCVWRTA